MTWETAATLAVIGLIVLTMAKNSADAKKRVPAKAQEPRSPEGPTSAMGEPEIEAPVFSSSRLTKGQTAMAALIVRTAQEFALDPAFMVALAVTESSLNPNAKGDNGDSLGLFQLSRKWHADMTETDLLDPGSNASRAMVDMITLTRRHPGHSYGDYAEAWMLGGAGRFSKGRRSPAKVRSMQRAIADLELSLDLTKGLP